MWHKILNDNLCGQKPQLLIKRPAVWNASDDFDLFRGFVITAKTREPEKFNNFSTNCRVSKVGAVSALKRVPLSISFRTQNS